MPVKEVKVNDELLLSILSTFVHFMLLEVLDVFIVYVYVACTNSSRVYSPLASSLPHHARHAPSPHMQGWFSVQ